MANKIHFSKTFIINPSLFNLSMKIHSLIIFLIWYGFNYIFNMLY